MRKNSIGGILMSLDGLGTTVKNALLASGWSMSFGLAVGSAAGYLATALKISKVINFVNLGIPVAVGMGIQGLLTAFVKGDSKFGLFIHHIAIPIVSALGMIYSLSYVSMSVYTVVAVASGAFVLGNLLQAPKKVEKPAQA